MTGNIVYKKNYVYRKAWTAIDGNGVQGSGDTQEEALVELRRWQDITGNIKWESAITGEVIR